MERRKLRLQKVIARGGISSRRAAERLIEEGRVRVNGRIVTELGTQVDMRDDRVEVDGRRLVAEKPVYVVLHKPRGVVSTVHDPEGRPSVAELVKEIDARLFPVGRLDFHTSGVLLLTNDGEFCDGLLHPRRDVPKTYVTKVSGIMTDRDLQRWEEGVELEDGKTRPAKVKRLRHEGDKTWLEVTIVEGRNQQLRRMGEATRFPVMRLARVAFAGVTAEGLRPGEFRALTVEELQDLRENFGVPRRVPKGAGEASGLHGRAMPRVTREPRPGRPHAGIAKSSTWAMETSRLDPVRHRERRGPGEAAFREERGGRGAARLRGAPTDDPRRPERSRDAPIEMGAKPRRHARPGADPRSAAGAERGPRAHGSAERGPRAHGSAERGPRAHGSAERGPRAHGSAERGPRAHGSAERGPRAHGSAERGPRAHGSAERGPRAHGSAERGPRAHGSAERGPRAHGSAERGPRASATLNRGRGSRGGSRQKP